jgi:hypothetical protein
MADPKIRIRRSATPNKVPETSQLQLGELAINTFDGKLYLEQDQTGGSGIATVIAVNPWSVGIGSLAYDTYFTAGDVGIGTTNPIARLDVRGDVNISGAVTATSFVGDGSGIFNLPGSAIGINTNTTNQAQLLTYAVSYGSTTGLGATDGLVYNPSSGRLGIGSATPAYALDVAGDINSSTDVKINGTGVLDTALALAIALG